MTGYRAPLAEMRFVMREIAGLEHIAGLPGFEEATPDLTDAALEEAGRLAGDVIAPLNAVGDRQGCRLENGVVRTPEGFRDAYWRFVEGGWNGVQCDPEFGGQGLPWLLGTAIQEMWGAANLSFSLCPLLTQAGIELLQAHGTPEQKKLYLEKLIAGVWTGTMNLTEPVAGSDVGALKTRAVRENGHYRITGQKIYITYGEHDFTENIVHMVLARTPDAPPGVKGISLFIVPKFLVNEDGSLGQRNDLRVASIEHKLGIMASPTCVMAYGDNGGAKGWLVGEENRGIEYMFTMMNTARLGVGLEGVSIADRAYQQARDFARERVQGRDALTGEDGAAIIRHPDVRRMLLSMRAQTEAARAIAYYAAGLLDQAKHGKENDTRRRDQTLVDLLIPIVKAWCTDAGVDVASIGVQVHGGMGFIEETGAAQHYRDARITPIYEGTNGIQALDLLGRKVLRDNGAAMLALVGQIRATDTALGAASGDDMAAIRQGVADGADALEAATEWVVTAARDGAGLPTAGATHYLRLAGAAIGGWLLARGALAAQRRMDAAGEDRGFLAAKIATARFFADQILPQGTALLTPLTRGGRTVLDFDEAQF